MLVCDFWSGECLRGSLGGVLGRLKHVLKTKQLVEGCLELVFGGSGQALGGSYDVDA